MSEKQTQSTSVNNIVTGCILILILIIQSGLLLFLVVKTSQQSREIETLKHRVENQDELYENLIDIYYEGH